MKKLIILMTMFISLNISAYATDNDPLGTTTIYGGGSYNDVKVEGDYAYVGTNAGLKIIDISDTSAPMQVGNYDTNISVHNITVSGNYVYLSDIYYESDGFEIIDISDKSNPVLAGSYTGNQIKKITVVNNYLYLVTEPNYTSQAAFIILDITDKSAPIEMVNYSLATIYSTALAVVGDYAYLVNEGDGLQILDISDKSNPLQVGSSLIYGDAISVAGDYAYINNYDGLHVYDVTDKSTPSLLGSYTDNGQSSYVYDIQIEGDYAYLTGSFGYGSSLLIVDFSDKNNPVSIGNTYLDGYSNQLDISGNHAFLASGPEGLVIVDISDKLNPVYISAYGKTTWSYAIAINGNYAYVASYRDGLEILDVTDKNNPVRIGNATTMYGVSRVEVEGNYAYVSSGDTFYILDITDPSNTVEAGNYTITGQSGFVSEFYIVGNYAYIKAFVGYEYNMVTLDITDKQNITAAGNYVITGYPNIRIEGDYMYIIEGTSLEVVDLTDKNNPELVGTHAWTGESSWVMDASIEGDYAYLLQSLGYQSNLLIFDLTDKTSITTVGSYDITGYAGRVAVNATNAYTASNEGLLIVDITDKENPTSVANYPMNVDGYLSKITVDGNYAYLTYGEGGLAIVKVNDTPPVASHLPTIYMLLL